MRKLNKIVVKYSISFYSKAQIHRSEILYKPDIYQEYAIAWNKKLVKIIKKGSKCKIRQYLRLYFIDITKCRNSYIQQWNLVTSNMHKKAKNKVLHDIRMYFNSQIQ